MARLDLVTAPAAIVSLADARAALRIRHTRDDVFLQGAIDAAVAYLDGPQGVLGKLLGTQTWNWSFGTFDAPLVLPIGPVTSIVSITYIDVAGATQTVSGASYYLVRGDDRDVIALVAGASWPVVFDRADAITVTFTGGLSTLPPRLKTAILLAVSHLNENRGSGQDLTGFDGNPSFSAMIADYRLFL